MTRNQIISALVSTPERFGSCPILIPIDGKWFTPTTAKADEDRIVLTLEEFS